MRDVRRTCVLAYSHMRAGMLIGSESRPCQPIEWYRLKDFQLLSLLRIAEQTLLASPCYAGADALPLCVPGSLLEQQLIFPDPVVLYVSPNNRGAMQLARELLARFPGLVFTKQLPQPTRKKLVRSSGKFMTLRRITERVTGRVTERATDVLQGLQKGRSAVRRPSLPPALSPCGSSVVARRRSSLASASEGGPSLSTCDGIEEDMDKRRKVMRTGEKEELAKVSALLKEG